MESGVTFGKLLQLIRKTVVEKKPSVKNLINLDPALGSMREGKD